MVLCHCVSKSFSHVMKLTSGVLFMSDADKRVRWIRFVRLSALTYDCKLWLMTKVQSLWFRDRQGEELRHPEKKEWLEGANSSGLAF